MDLQPTQDRILAEEIREEMSSGGIIIPQTVDPTGGDRLAARRVRVIAVGPGTVHVTPAGEKVRVTIPDMLGHDVKPGSVLITTKYIQLLNVDSRKSLRLFRADDVSAVVSE